MRALHAGWLVSLAEAARNHLGAVLSPPSRVLYDRTFLGAADAAATAGELAVLLLLAGRGFGKTRTGAEMIDPAATSSEDADEFGMFVAGKDGQGRGWVLADASGRYPPAE